MVIVIGPAKPQRVLAPLLHLAGAIPALPIGTFLGEYDVTSQITANPAITATELMAKLGTWAQQQGQGTVTA